MIDATPAVAADGLIYFSQPWAALMARRQDGSKAWMLNTDDKVTAPPNIGRDGTIYVADGDYLQAINSSRRLAPPAKSPWPVFRANPRHTGRVESKKSP